MIHPIVADWPDQSGRGGSVPLAQPARPGPPPVGSRRYTRRMAHHRQCVVIRFHSARFHHSWNEEQRPVGAKRTTKMPSRT